jgi:alginate O-acetyltransferase complex protein AlgI
MTWIGGPSIRETTWRSSLLFNSFPFICMFSVAALVYALLRAKSSRVVSQGFLLLISLGFYSFAAYRQLPLLIGSLIFNWYVARGAGNTLLPQRTRKRWATCGVLINVAFLSLFKYLNFFLVTLQPVLRIDRTLPDWGLPLGVSFFTLTQIMYLVDCYEGIVPPSSLFDHASFVTFFPYLVAGPMTRAKLMVQQFHEKAHTPPNSQEVAQGFALFTLGLVKKTAFADSLVRLADTAFLAPATTSALETWISVLAYWMQIYFDFSGYSDMAVGAARMLGYTIPFNFNAPYKSKSIIEFWQRWHISLSNFITTYLYTPILRAFKGRATLAKAAVASILAMSISGLWHGPAWTFVAWGFCHGVALTVNQYSRKKFKLKVPPALGWLMTMAFVVSAGILFRATDLHNAFQVFAALIPTGGFAAAKRLSFVFSNPETVAYVLPALLSFPFAWFGPTSQEMAASLRPTARTTVAYALLAFIALVLINSVIAKTFVYFGF